MRPETHSQMDTAFMIATIAIKHARAFEVTDLSHGAIVQWLLHKYESTGVQKR